MKEPPMSSTLSDEQMIAWCRQQAQMYRDIAAYRHRSGMAIQTEVLRESELLEAIASRLSASPSAPQWQPIETAPKDGTKVMLWWRYEVGGEVFDVWATGRWQILGGEAGWSGESFHHTSEGRFWTKLIGERPTHWAHLVPPAPSAPPSEPKKD